MELPAYHMPQAKALGIHVWDKAKHSFKKLFTVIFVSTVIIWAMLYFRFDWQILGEEETAEYSILGVLGSVISPIFTPLGWGTQLVGTINGQTMNMGWAFAVSALNGLVAKENAIATFATIANSIGAGIADDVDGTLSFSYLVQACGSTLSVGALYSFIFFNVLTIPCFAAVATAKAELPKGTLKWTILFWLGVSYVVSCMVYTCVTFIWPIAIWGTLLVGAIVGIYFYNKHKVAVDGPLHA
jgi:ferrous iron transport protein B